MQFAPRDLHRFCPMLCLSFLYFTVSCSIYITGIYGSTSTTPSPLDSNHAIATGYYHYGIGRPLGVCMYSKYAGSFSSVRYSCNDDKSEVLYELWYNDGDCQGQSAGKYPFFNSSQGHIDCDTNVNYWMGFAWGDNCTQDNDYGNQSPFVINKCLSSEGSSMLVSDCTDCECTMNYYYDDVCGGVAYPTPMIHLQCVDGGTCFTADPQICLTEQKCESSYPSYPTAPYPSIYPTSPTIPEPTYAPVPTPSPTVDITAPMTTGYFAFATEGIPLDICLQSRENGAESSARHFCNEDKTAISFSLWDNLDCNGSPNETAVFINSSQAHIDCDTTVNYWKYVVWATAPDNCTQDINNYFTQFVVINLCIKSSWTSGSTLITDCDECQCTVNHYNDDLCNDFMYSTSYLDFYCSEECRTADPQTCLIDQQCQSSSYPTAAYPSATYPTYPTYPTATTPSPLAIGQPIATGYFYDGVIKPLGICYNNKMSGSETSSRFYCSDDESAVMYKIWYNADCNGASSEYVYLYSTDTHVDCDTKVNYWMGIIWDSTDCTQDDNNWYQQPSVTNVCMHGNGSSTMLSNCNDCECTMNLYSDGVCGNLLFSVEMVDLYCANSGACVTADPLVCSMDQKCQSSSYPSYPTATYPSYPSSPSYPTIPEPTQYPTHTAPSYPTAPPPTQTAKPTQYPTYTAPSYPTSPLYQTAKPTPPIDYDRPIATGYFYDDGVITPLGVCYGSTMSGTTLTARYRCGVDDQTVVYEYWNNADCSGESDYEDIYRTAMETLVECDTKVNYWTGIIWGGVGLDCTEDTNNWSQQSLVTDICMYGDGSSMLISDCDSCDCNRNHYSDGVCGTLQFSIKMVDLQCAHSAACVTADPNVCSTEQKCNSTPDPTPPPTLTAKPTPPPTQTAKPTVSTETSKPTAPNVTVIPSASFTSWSARPTSKPTAVHTSKPTIPEQTASTDSGSAEKVQIEDRKSGKNNTVLIVLIVCITIVLSLAIIGVIVYKVKKGDDTKHNILHTIEQQEIVKDEEDDDDDEEDGGDALPETEPKETATTQLIETEN